MDRELIDYLPDFLKEFREFKELMRAEQPEIELLWNYIDKVLNDYFIEDARESGIKRFETILSIKPKDTDSLEDRRFRIMARWNEQLPYTMNVLRMQLEKLCGADGYKVELKNNEYTLIVRVALVAKNNYNDVKSYLERMTPANMVIDLSLLYNQYKNFKDYTYKQLKTKTYKQLREEAID